MTTDTEKRLAEIRERAEKATRGPWRSMRRGNQYINDQTKLVGASEVSGIKRPWNAASSPSPIHQEDVCRFTDEDADFIAHARSDIPFLLAEIERLTGRNNSLLRIDESNKVHVGRAMSEVDRLTAERDAAGRVINGIDARSAASDCGKFRLLLSEDYERIRALSPSTLNKPE